MTREGRLLLERAEEVLEESRQLGHKILVVLEQAATRQHLVALRWDVEAVRRQIHALADLPDEYAPVLREARALESEARELLGQLSFR